MLLQSIDVGWLITEHFGAALNSLVRMSPTLKLNVMWETPYSINGRLHLNIRQGIASWST